MTRSAVEVTDELYALLRMRYRAPDFALIEGVANGTGTRADRWCDALAFSLWPSRGLTIDGLEVKAARSDWLREMQDPEKARAFSRYCDRWYVVAAPGVVKLEELPASWGLLVPRGKGLRVAKVAEDTERLPPTPAFMAAVARYAVRSGPLERALADERARLRAELDAEVRHRVEGALKRGASELGALREAVASFEAASGIKIHRWSAGDVGAAVAQVVRGRALLKDLRAMARTVAIGQERLKALLDEVEGVAP